MSIFKNTRFILGAFMLFFIICCKAQVQTNEVINYPSLGISFEIPATWEGQEVENGFLMSNTEVSGFILLTTHDLKNMQAIQQEMEQVFTIGPNSKLAPTNVLQTITSHTMAGEYAGTISDKLAKAYILGMLNTYGLGLTLICGSNTNTYSDDLKNAGISIVKSVVFYVPKTKSVVDTNKIESNEWKEKFKNCRLTYMESYSSYGSGGYGKKIKIDLCGKGYFNHSSYSSMSLDSGSYSAGYGTNKQGAGTWKILENQTQIVLQLNFYNGEVYEHVVTVDADDKTYLNGNRYFRTYEGAGKHSPACD